MTGELGSLQTPVPVRSVGVPSVAVDNGVDKVVFGLPVEWRLRAVLISSALGAFAVAVASAQFPASPVAAALMAGVPSAGVPLLVSFGGRVTLSPAGLRVQQAFIPVHFCPWEDVQDIRSIKWRSDNYRSDYRYQRIVVDRIGRSALTLPHPFIAYGRPAPDVALKLDRIFTYWRRCVPVPPRGRAGRPARLPRARRR
ncbi:hypothetical protein ACIRPK_22310 [Kitasatospora sp. NPDC101801]|uniref:hypothetical protein n=1 Tax=Kitasatospora sp. NPDC101801 TaxID=3364103 RepID=UPI00380EC5CC